MIQPDNFDEPMCCKLEVVLLDTAVFEALSYVWGDPSADQEITISGGKFKVRENVLSALLRFRKTDEPRGLWIDALCINQEDILERNQQVALMTEIYSRASEVLIWLGKDDSLIRVAMAELADFGINWLDDGGPMGSDYGPSWKANTIKFLQNAWFMRAWIFQEIVCSKAATVYAGAADSWEGQPILVPGKKTNLLEWSDLSSFYDIVGESRMLEKVPTGLYTFLGPMSQSQKQFHTEDGSAAYLDLLTLLEVRRDSKATDARDKVFSLLGVSAEGKDGLIRADYGKSVEDVYVNVATTLLLSRTDLRLLNAVQKGQDRPEPLPSWVPDWSQPWQVRSLVNRLYDPKHRYRPVAKTAKEFSATAGTTRELEINDKYPLQLKVKGRSFAYISAIIPFSAILENPEEDYLPGRGFPLKDKYLPSEVSYLTALCSTLIADLGDSTEAIPEIPFVSDIVKLTKKR
jgi:hypothetical protein